MSSIQQKITRPAKKQENTTHNEGEKNQSIEMHPEMIQMKELVDKDNETVILTVFLMFKKLESRLSMLNRNIKNIKNTI